MNLFDFLTIDKRTIKRVEIPYLQTLVTSQKELTMRSTDRFIINANLRIRAATDSCRQLQIPALVANALNRLLRYKFVVHGICGACVDRQRFAAEKSLFSSLYLELKEALVFGGLIRCSFGRFSFLVSSCFSWLFTVRCNSPKAPRSDRLLHSFLSLSDPRYS